jgi:hypothetical protein
VAADDFPLTRLLSYTTQHGDGLSCRWRRQSRFTPLVAAHSLQNICAFRPVLKPSRRVSAPLYE